MQVLADGRVRRTRAEWQRVLEDFERSGLSASAFCRREKISRAAFGRWRKEVEKGTSEAASFVELAVPEATRAPAGPSGELELLLPGGVILRWKS